ncbi:MAG: hypothetical protein J7641_03600 [Cyanobacteria bacterium SID2]|nr:hypothetical protein [Cyanobacteria bacterium SID2]MBP0003162.1 hypothetical protein [Cyanobacteria bacterium SBC]
MSRNSRDLFPIVWNNRTGIEIGYLALLKLHVYREAYRHRLESESRPCRRD